MKFKILNNNEQKTYAIILDENDRVEECLKGFAKDQRIRSAQFSAIGAFKKAKVGFFDLSKRDYIPIEFNEQVEVLNLSGDVAIYKDEPVLHIHVVVGKQDGTAHGGHLLEAIVRPTLEIILTESPSYLERKMNKDIGIPLISIEP
ncbi:MAG TPA: PPC domain-containing DNA-binding protein [Cyclobacteriaceae bacterium]|nr:PPC domain-containing DNA-binding protein [Cyclobacteriaceae bacterium]